MMKCSRWHQVAVLGIIAGVLTLASGITALADGGRDQLGWIVIDGELSERPSPFAWLVGDSAGTTFRDMVAKFDDAAKRSDVSSLLVHLKDLKANRSQLETLGWAIDRVRKAGKPVYVYATSYGPGELLLGSFADEIIIQPGGIVSFPGIYAEEIYLADTLSWAGIRADMLQVGDYKGASEQLGRNSPSPEWSSNIDALLDDIWAQMRERLMVGRGYDSAQLDTVLEQAWLTPADHAVELGLVDAAVDILDLKAYLSRRTNGARITQDLGKTGDEFGIDFNNPFAIFALLGRKPDHTPKRNTIAVLHIDGIIIDGESTEATLFGGRSVGDRTIRKALKEIEDADLVKGLVVRINSPGGSAIASEMIWQGLRRVAQEKPVYISVGSMAASGGYYVAVGGDKIFVDPTSIVGSIGVVSGKLVMGDLYDKLKIGVTPRARGPRAGMMSSVVPWTDVQRAEMRQWMVEVYDLFVSHVAEARGERVEIAQIAEGRLFTGRQAIENGMADALADFDGTIAHLASDVGLTRGAYDVMTYPGPLSFEEMIEEMFGAFLQAPVTAGGARLAAGDDALMIRAAMSSLRLVMGERAWPQVRDALNGLMLLRDEPVILISPRILVVQ